MRARPSMIPLVVAAGVALAASATTRATSSVQLLEVRPRHDAGRLSVLLEASAPVAYTSTQPDPFTVVLDLRHASVQGAVNRFAPSGDGPVASVALEQARAADGASVARVRLGLAEPAVAKVRSTRNTILVEFPDVLPPTPIAASPASAVAAAPSGSATELLSVVSEKGEGVARVRLRANGTLAPKVHEVGDLPPRIVVDLPGVRPRVPAVLSVGGGDIARVRVATNSTSPLVTRVVLDLTRRAPFRVEDGTKEVVIVVGDAPAATPAATSAPTPEPGLPAPAAPPRAAAPVDAAPAPAAPAAAAPVIAARIEPEPELRLQRDEPAAAESPEPAAPSPATSAASVLARQPEPAPRRAPAPQVTPPTAALGTPGPSDGSKQFTGHPVSLDFQGVDLRAVLRTFGEITGLNLVIDEQVQGKVDVALRDVPWDQALDIILRANKLGYTVEGTIVRIAPLLVLAEEEAARRKLAEEKAQSGELVVVTRVLNYSKAALLEPLLKSALSPRGRTAVDPRTNTLIIYDLPEFMARVSSLLTTLDQPELQVEIEARIIQTTTNFARELGIKWGFIGQVAPELGNATNLAFPNSGALFGATGDTTGNTGYVDTPPGAKPASTGVNLGINNPTGAIGLTLGAVNGALRLSAELSALEGQGKVRSLLTPRVVTQNNVKATITRGQEIPYSTITSSASTGGALLVPTVQFRTAALVLTVTPRITNANTVILEVDVDNGSPGETQVNGNRAINTQRAQTTVLVADGATTVIGGIQGSEAFDSTRRVPGLWKVPWLGRLFRNDRDVETTEEILIFITPRIIRMPAQVAPAAPTAAPQL